MAGTGGNTKKTGAVIVRIHNSWRRRHALPRATNRFLIAIFVATALAGCATSINKLSKSEIQSLHIESIDISYKPDAHIWWGNAEREYAAKVGAPAAAEPKSKNETLPGNREGDAYREVMDTPEAKRYLRDKLAGLLKDRMGYFLHKYQGTRTVRLEVEVHSFVIPSPLQRIALGGTPMLAAVTVLRDSATGEVLGKLDRMAAGYAGNGILGVALDQAGNDLEDRVLDNYVANVRDWLSGD